MHRVLSQVYGQQAIRKIADYCIATYEDRGRELLKFCLRTLYVDRTKKPGAVTHELALLIDHMIS